MNPANSGVELRRAFFDRYRHCRGSLALEACVIASSSGLAAAGPAPIPERNEIENGGALYIQPIVYIHASEETNNRHHLESFTTRETALE